MKLFVIALIAALPIAAQAQNRNALLAYTSISTPSSPTEQTHTLVYSVHENGRLVGAPTLELEEGLTTAVTAGRYALRVRVDRAAAPGGHAFVVRSSLYRPAEPEWQLVARPELTVAPGQPATLQVATPQGDRVSIRVTMQ